VRRFLTLALASVGVLIAQAILDTGSRASAAYLSMASRAVGASAGTDATTHNTHTPAKTERVEQSRLFANQQPAGAGASTSSTVSSSPTSPAAEIPPKEPPSANLVVYFREPAAHLKLTKYIDSILDPPRQV
jgi:hypothetical protein